MAAEDRFYCIPKSHVLVQMCLAMRKSVSECYKAVNQHAHPESLSEQTDSSVVVYSHDNLICVLAKSFFTNYI